MTVTSSGSPDSKPSKSANLGQLAEALVAQWLRQQEWQILSQRWHCRWGELDLVAMAQPQPCVAFVEVKARSRNNWDADGLLAVTPAKREKLALAAQLFLSAYPALAELPCRFDVAIVNCRSIPSSASPVSPSVEFIQLIELGQPVTLGQYRLTLQHYIPAAFD